MSEADPQVREVRGPRKDLTRVRNPERIIDLSVLGKVESLAGIEGMTALEGIWLDREADPELSRLESVSGQITVASIFTGAAEADFTPLSRFPPHATAGPRGVSHRRGVAWHGALRSAEPSDPTSDACRKRLAGPDRPQLGRQLQTRGAGPQRLRFQ